MIGAVDDEMTGAWVGALVGFAVAFVGEFVCRAATGGALPP